MFHVNFHREAVATALDIRAVAAAKARVAAAQVESENSYLRYDRARHNGTARMLEIAVERLDAAETELDDACESLARLVGRIGVLGE